MKKEKIKEVEVLKFFNKIQSLGEQVKFTTEELDSIKLLCRESAKRNPRDTMKIVLYTRGIRYGLGKRFLGRVLLKELATVAPAMVSANLHMIPEVGRWDDLYALEGTSCEPMMWLIIGLQLHADIVSMEKGESISLLAKWLKSANTSSRDSRRLGRKTARRIGMTLTKYSKTLTTLRSYANITEVNMCNNTLENIEYVKVHKQAFNKYVKSFVRKDNERAIAYLEGYEKREYKKPKNYPKGKVTYIQMKKILSRDELQFITEIVELRCLY
ncbi:hypothetical protein D3C81_08420 [compost metagenome]